MIIVCSYCKKVLGWKCHVCGGPLMVGSETAGYCSSCDEDWGPDKGGTTHGICPGCAKEQKGKLEEGK